MAPEYALRGHLTDKADVYSFGVVALEIVSGKSNNTSYSRGSDTVYLLDMVIFDFVNHCFCMCNLSFDQIYVHFFMASIELAGKYSPPAGDSIRIC